MERLRKFWKKLVVYAKAVAAWCRAHGKVVAATLVAILGAGWAIQYHQRKTRSLRDDLAVSKARGKVAALDARREALRERGEAAKAELATLAEERAAIQRETLSLSGDVSKLTDAEVERAFRDLY